MDESDISDILVAIARLQERTDNLEKYIYKDMKGSIYQLSKKVESRFKWTVGLLITCIISNIAMVLFI